MDFQALVDGIGAMTCVVSVEDLGNGRYGKICIVTGNKGYIDSIEKPAPGAELLVQKFVPNSEYTNYLTKDLNFEDYSYRAAVEGKCLHSYAKPERMQGIWFNMSFIPIGHRDGNICYCLYIMEIDFSADTKRLSNVSSDTAVGVLDTCIKLRSSRDFKETMGEVIEDIREQCDASYCCILLVNSYEMKCTVLCESYKDKSLKISMNDYLDADFYELAQSWNTLISGSNCLIAKNEQDMEVVKERNPKWYKSMVDADIKSIVIFPLKFREDLLGYIWAANFKSDDAPKIKETLETTTFILGSEINNYLLMDRLKILSSKDMLTGVMNRNEMNNLIDKIYNLTDDNPNSVGVIFVDLNGLKTVNDECGHVAGDILLKNAAAALEEVFLPSDIYRAGGDEFTIIVTGISESELLKKVEAVREAAEHYENVSFAIGYCYDENKHNVKEALRIADERMYEDKKKYYEMHPEKKKR